MLVGGSEGSGFFCFLDGGVAGRRKVLSVLYYLAARRRREALPVAVEWEGSEDLGPLPYSWCRVAFSVTLVPPKQGRVFSLEQGPRTRRVVMYAPRAVVVSLTLAGLGSVPWVREVVEWGWRVWGVRP